MNINACFPPDPFSTLLASLWRRPKPTVCACASEGRSVCCTRGATLNPGCYLVTALGNLVVRAFASSCNPWQQAIPFKALSLVSAPLRPRLWIPPRPWGPRGRRRTDPEGGERRRGDGVCARDVRAPTAATRTAGPAGPSTEQPETTEGKRGCPEKSPTPPEEGSRRGPGSPAPPAGKRSPHRERRATAREFRAFPSRSEERSPRGATLGPRGGLEPPSGDPEPGPSSQLTAPGVPAGPFRSRPRPSRLRRRENKGSGCRAEGETFGGATAGSDVAPLFRSAGL